MGIKIAGNVTVGGAMTTTTPATGSFTTLVASGTSTLADVNVSGTVTGITATMVGLGSVDNTPDLLKPVSTDTQSALDMKASLAGPTFTGTVIAPTLAAGTDTDAVATTKFVKTAITALIDGAPEALDTLKEIAAYIDTSGNAASGIATSLALKADKTDVTASLALKADKTDVTASLALKADLSGADFTGAVSSTGDISISTVGSKMKFLSSTSGVYYTIEVGQTETSVNSGVFVEGLIFKKNGAEMVSLFIE